MTKGARTGTSAEPLETGCVSAHPRLLCHPRARRAGGPPGPRKRPPSRHGTTSSVINRLRRLRSRSMLWALTVEARGVHNAPRPVASDSPASARAWRPDGSRECAPSRIGEMTVLVPPGGTAATAIRSLRGLSTCFDRQPEVEHPTNRMTPDGGLDALPPNQPSLRKRDRRDLLGPHLGCRGRRGRQDPETPWHSRCSPRRGTDRAASRRRYS
jgi:hypothetical protein